MSKITNTFAYSVGKKLIMALTGLFLIIFLLEHLAGNMLILVGEEAFLRYAEFMGAGWNIPIRIMEVVLFAGFIFHIVDGLLITKANKDARPQKYAVSSGNAASSWFSRNMAWTGIVMLVFLVLHLISFFIEARFAIDIGIGVDPSVYTPDENVVYGVGNDVLVKAGHPNIHAKVVSHFQVWWYSLIYIVAMVFVGFHLNHGFQSAFQTMGWSHKKYTPIVKAIGTGYAVLVPLGYIAIPLSILLGLV